MLLLFTILDCPWIISNQNICYLDPQNEPAPGRRYQLSSFFENPGYFSHHNCFSEQHFGFKPSREFIGTVFRFPLRTASYSSCISPEIHGVDEIRSVLFEPLTREGEHIIPFLKYVNSIRILEKVNNKVSVVHSVAVADRFKQSLYAHRTEITLFAEEKCYYERTGLFVTLYPIDTNGDETVWLVMNMLGFGMGGSENEFYKFYCKNTLKYIPWFGIALPTGAKSSSSIESNHTWRYDWNGSNVKSVLEFIQSQVRFSLPLPSDSVLDTNDGKYYCFLPIPKETLFPFHIHGYFALDDNRKSPKWPSSYDRSPDSKWNLFQTQMLGTVLYASFLHLSVLNLSHPQPDNYHYKLFGDFNIHEMEDSLFSIIQREGLRLLMDRNMVFSKSLNWIPFGKALYAPSTVPELLESVWTSDTERCCINLLLSLSEPIVELPSNVIALIANYQFLKESIKPQILCPKRIRDILRLNSSVPLCHDFLATKRNAIQLLNIVLWDLDHTINVNYLEAALEGIPLLLTADCSILPRTFLGGLEIELESFYISEKTPKYLSIFPGLESRFVDPTLPQNIHNKLVNISRVIDINIRDITHIEPDTFEGLLTQFFNTTFHSVSPPLTWTPGCNSHPRAKWITSLWELICSNSTLLPSVKNFPILPQGLLSAQSIQLLSVHSNEAPYIEFDATKGTTEIETFLSKAGCKLCHRQFFIQCFEDFVLRPVPQCLVSVLSREPILTQFISLISKASAGIRRQLIELFNSIPLDSKEARDILKRIPIFLNFKGNWLSLNTEIGQRYPVLAPKSINDSIHYPAHILTPFDSSLLVLYQKLNISHKNEKEFIRVDLVPYMISDELFSFPQTRNALAVWVLERLPALQLATGDELLEFLSDTKWLVDSSTQSDKPGQVKLFKPSSMLDPVDPLLKRLIDRNNEGFFPNDIYNDHFEKMKKYFEFKSNDNLNSRLRKEICKAAINNLTSKKCHGDWLRMFEALLKLISNYFEKCELRDQESFWIEFNKKFVLPQMDILTPLKLPFKETSSFLLPSQVIACSHEQFPLVSYVKRFIVIPEMEEGDTSRDILSCMGFETHIPCSYVVEQLNYIIDSFRNEKRDSANFHKVLSKIYQYLSLHPTSPSLRELRACCIFSEERREFIDISNISETIDFEMRPYLYSYGNLGFNCLQLFRSLGMSANPTADQFSSVLNTIYTQSNGKPINLQQLEIVLKILEVSRLNSNNYEIYVPGHDNVMYPTSEERLVFSDEKWLDRIQICLEFPFVFAHESISKMTAISLGMKSFYEHVASSAIYRTLDQEQTVIQQIKGALESNTDELGLLREMVQNSDDSGASQLRILFDYRCHPSLYKPDTSSLLCRGMHHWQGPAIWFYNDRVMQEPDCQNILCVGGGGKANDVTKVGRDGIGFCSAFYLTDLPSFVSGGTLHILDPHREYTEQKYFQSNVCKIEFVNKKFISYYQDQLAPYQGLFGCNMLNNETYRSTLFRIPLRSAGIKSQLSVKSYDRNKMESLQRLVIKYVENILLFTENLTLIEISELRENTFTNARDHIKPIYWVKREPEGCQSFTKLEKYKVEKCLNGELVDSIEHSFKRSITSSTLHSPKHWLLCYSSGAGGELAAVVNSMQVEGYRIHAPVTAVAFDLDRLTERNLQCEANLFCLHPLSVELQLPYHCNGMFELDSGKMGLYTGDTEPLRKRWNTFLISNTLTNAVISLATRLAEEADPDLYSHFLYNIFPKEMISHSVWRAFCLQITQKLMECKAPLFPVTSSQGDSWSCFSEVVVLNELELKDKIVEAYFNKQFLNSIKLLLINIKGLKVVSVPAELYQSSGLLSSLLTQTNSSSIIGTERIVELFFDSLNEMSIGLLMGLLPALIASHSSIPKLSNLISKVPCIPCGDSHQLRVPSDVIDPNNSILSDLYYPQENRLPSIRSPLFTADSLCYQKLRQELSLITNQLSLSCLQERIDKIVAEGDTHLAEKILLYLNQDTFSNSDAEQIYAQLSNIKFLPTAQDYPLSIQPKHSLAAPNHVVVYPLRHFLGLQRTVLSHDVSSLRNAIKLLRIQPNSTSEITTDMLLHEIVLCRENCEELSLHRDLLEKMSCLYGALAEREGQDKAYIIDNLDKKCIFIPEFGFVSPERVVLEHERSFSPYIHSIKLLYRAGTKSNKFFLSIGVGQTLTLEQCLDVLKELSETAGELNSTDEALALNLIDEMANRLFGEIGDSSSTATIYLLGEDKRIHQADESIFFDLKWKDKEGYRGDIKINNKSYYFVHPQISNNTAHKLGAISLSSSIITIASTKLKFGYEVKSQQERLTNRLKDIVDRYEAPVEVFKELLQNADDAKATTVKFLFDMNSYGNISLIRPEMGVCQGPSLYVFNDRTFSPNDFKNIMDIGGETKKTDTTKIGRFGLGFNTVYHLTDIPSFVSGRFIHILDPHLLCGERGLQINFTENEAILKEYYSDQFAVYNDIFGCNVFSTAPYDGTLFRFPFRTSQTISEIKPTGVFNSQAEIKKLQNSFLEIIEQVIFFLQYVQNIEVYERREKEEKIHLICKVDKTFKTRPYPTSFLNNYEDHFNKIVKCGREDPKSAVEIIEISRDKSSCQEYIVSYASGTGECVDVINKFDELKQASVLPVAAVGIPRKSLTCKRTNRKEENYRLFCFLPIPKRSPYPMHINGYFHLSSYRSELHITDENAHLTQWNCSLINDALPNALLSLLMHIREEVLSQSASSDLKSQLEVYYSYFPVTETNEKPWDTYQSKTIEKIINSDLPLFPCALHSESWLSFSEASFLTYNFTEEFVLFLKNIAAEEDIFFVDIPESLNHKLFFQNLFRKSGNSFDLGRVCEELLFPNLEDIKESSLEDLKLVVSNLISLSHLEQVQLQNLAFIPCGDLDPVLRVPNEVVHPKSKFSSIYYPDEKRLPHTDFHDLFESRKLTRLGVIRYELTDDQLIERCEVAQTVYSEDREKGHKHSLVLLEYINIQSSIPESLSKIDFLPVWEDPLFIHLDCRDTGYLVPAEKCYSYSCRYLITHQSYALSEDVSNMWRALKLLNIPSSVEDPNIVVELLEVLCSKEESLSHYEDDSLNERMKHIYCWLSEFCFPAKELADSERSDKEKPQIDFWTVSNEKKKLKDCLKNKQLKDCLKNKSWIWHPTYKHFYGISQVKIASDFLSIKSKFLITFPYPELLATSSKSNNVKLFFEFMGLRPTVDHSEAIEILSKMRLEYNGDRLISSDFELAKRLILEEIGKYYENNRRETPAEEIALLSENNCLHLARDLFRNDIIWMEDTFSDTDREFIVNRHIPRFVAHLLGAQSMRSTYFEEEAIEGIKMEEFGQNEAISDRIDSIKSQINCDVTILNELLQNAEDAGATEIAFILDNQEYPTEHLCFAPDTHREWQKLQSTPSLLVYNNRAFTENDLKGIQKVGIGGKRSRQTIGRFGIGFNAVYHLTLSPCLLTSPPAGDTTTFCIFDPYRKYLNISEKSQLPGKKIIIENDRKYVFKDQLRPYEVLPITADDRFRDMLTNLRLGESYSIFRLPLTAKKKDPQKNIDKILEQLLTHSKRLLLFLKNIERIDIVCIDRSGVVQPKGTLKRNTNPHPSISPNVPEFYSNQYLRSVEVTVKEISTETWTPGGATNEVKVCEPKVKKETTEWLCYNYEHSIEYYPDLGKFSNRVETEKLRKVFGSIALNIKNIQKQQKNNSYMFCFLPIGTSLCFPVHINAPLIVDEHRHFVKFSERGQEGGEEQWEYSWHKSIIQHILVPLYAKMLLDLRDRQVIPSSLSPADYYKWYYTVFPSVSISKASNAPFFELISRELYTLLHETHQPVLVSNNFKDFYSINEGVFKAKHDRELDMDKLYSALDSIQFPLTGAPERILYEIKSLKLDYQTLQPEHLADFLILNKQLLSREGDFPCELRSSVLSLQEVLLLLEFCLKGSNSEWNEIPLKIDSKEILCSFSTSEEDRTFLSDYAPLLPHCSSNFIHSEFPKQINDQLTHLKFISNLSPEFLAEHIVIDEDFTKHCYLLFWKFAIEECKNVDRVIELFGTHKLVPVYHRGDYPDTKSAYTYPVSELDCVAREVVLGSSSTLCTVLRKLDCPFLDLGEFKEVSQQKMLVFVRNHVISELSKVSIQKLVGCLSRGRFLTAELEAEEALLLRKPMSGMQVDQIQFSAKVLVELRIFLTNNKTLKSISEFRVCFVNEGKFKIDDCLSQKLEAEGIGIFSAEQADENPTSLIEHVANEMGIRLINTQLFISEYILPSFPELSLEEQKRYLIAISKLDEAVEQNLYRQLSVIPFIKRANSDEDRVTANQLYSRKVQLFKLCLKAELLPKDWDEESLTNILANLGLNTLTTLPILRDCACVIADNAAEFAGDNKITKFLSILVNFFKEMRLTSQTDIALMAAISNIKFVPIKKIAKIEGKELRYEREMGNLQSALPHSNLGMCGTMCYILPIMMSDIPQNLWQHLNIPTNPPCSVVLDHLRSISEQCQEQLPEDNAAHEKLFHETYQFLQAHPDFTTQQLEFNCIINNGTIFSTTNLVFELDQELFPYLFKLPSSLSNFQNFLTTIGVQRTATFTHYLSVLRCIYVESTPADHHLDNDQMDSCAKIAFSALVTMLRSLPSDTDTDLDPADTHVLTDDNRIMPCDVVYYADNTSLLAKVRKDTRIEINILKTLPPDENGSGVPPTQLKIQNLTQVLIPSVSSTISSYKVVDDLEKTYSQILKSGHFHRSLMRLYYHETNKNIKHLKLKNGQMYYSEDQNDFPTDEGYKLVLDLVKELIVISVSQIDLDLTDQRIDQLFCIPNVLSCYIEQNSNTFYVNSSLEKRNTLPTFVAKELNSFLAKIFSKNLNALEFCFKIKLDTVMSVFDELEIQNCPFLDEIPLSQSNPALVPPVVPSATHATPAATPAVPPPASTPALPPVNSVPSPPSGPITWLNLTSHRTYRRAIRADTPRPGVGADRPDPQAAKLWIRTAQCDWRAAIKLSKKTAEECTLFPPQACFLCFEATLKALIAVLYLCGGSCCDISLERNLTLLLEEVAKHTTEAVATKLAELAIPLMNYDEPTRFPCMTSGIGFYTPREFYSLEMARGATKSVRQILHKLKEATRHRQPSLESLMIEEGDSGYIEHSCLSINQMFNCKSIYSTLQVEPRKCIHQLVNGYKLCSLSHLMHYRQSDTSSDKNSLLLKCMLKHSFLLSKYSMIICRIRMHTLYTNTI